MLFRYRLHRPYLNLHLIRQHMIHLRRRQHFFRSPQYRYRLHYLDLLFQHPLPVSHRMQFLRRLIRRLLQ